MPQGNGGVVGPANDPTSSTASGVWGLKEHAEAVGAGEWPPYSPSSPNFQISRSLRFNSADSAYLSRTLTAPTNNLIWTWSVWLKVNGGSYLFTTTATDGAGGYIYFTGGILVYWDDRQGGNATVLATSARYRDQSAWYHIIVVTDRTQATASNRAKIYVNGSQVTEFGTADYPNQNQPSQFNSAIPHYITAPSGFFSGYMTEINFIDGQALTPSSFGETNATTGVWSPIAYAGSYGTNGFYLNFSDNSGVTSTTLGKDDSGNGNNWTPSGSPGFSVTAGAGNDSLVDSPTQYGTDTGAGGEVRGNYCTWNPLDKANGVGTITNGNLDASASDATEVTAGVRSTLGSSTGKWYWEVTLTSGTGVMIGASDLNFTLKNGGGWGGANCWCYSINGTTYTLYPAYGVSYGSSYTTNDVIGVAFDADAGTLTFYKNGVSQGVAFSGLTGKKLAPYFGTASGTQAVTLNAGQRPFAYTAPSGFKALVTTNLPETTVVQGDKYFDTKLWAGNSSTQSIALEFAPGWIWNKSTGDAAGHAWWDVLRGTGALLSSQSTDAETTGYNAITSFGSNAISLGADNTGSLNGRTNETGRNYVGWVWKAGVSNVTNEYGTISSTVSVSTTSGFSIVTFTTSGSHSTATIGHGLGAVPSMIILKNRNGTPINWNTYHRSLGNTKALYLQSTSAAITASGFWNDTSPTSAVFTVGNNLYPGINHVAYCFAEVEGFSKFGSYTGNGSADGPFVYTGFRPAWVLFKNADDGSVGWYIYDTKRDTYNLAENYLRAESLYAETTANNKLDILSNGFKIRTTGATINQDTNTIIYAAFAENPFKYSLGR